MLTFACTRFPLAAGNPGLFCLQRGREGFVPSQMVAPPIQQICDGIIQLRKSMQILKDETLHRKRDEASLPESAQNSLQGKSVSHACLKTS